MSAPRVVWVNVYRDGMLFAYDSEAQANEAPKGNAATTHKYRLVRPKREPLYWVLKEKDSYAAVSGARTPMRALAIRFFDKDQSVGAREILGIRDSFKPVPVYRKEKP